MSHVNESCHTYEWVMSHVNESCHMWMSPVTQVWDLSLMNESRTFMCVMRVHYAHLGCHLQTSHVPVTYEWVTYLCVRGMSFMNESRTFVCVMRVRYAHLGCASRRCWRCIQARAVWHRNESCPIWISHIPYEWVMSHVDTILYRCLSDTNGFQSSDKSCHVRMSHVTYRHNSRSFPTRHIRLPE